MYVVYGKNGDSFKLENLNLVPHILARRTYELNTLDTAVATVAGGALAAY